MSDELTNRNVPAVIDNGFDDTAADSKLIRGIIIRCVDGEWKDADGTVISSGAKLVAWATTEALQLWRNKRPVETIVKRPGIALPDLDELNFKIPQKEWELGIDGNPRPPWVKQNIVYLLDPHDGAEFTFISGTVGAAIVIERLKDKTRNLRVLRDDHCVPVVSLSNKLITTKFGSKLRPEFVIEEWRTLGAPRVSAQPTAAIEHIGSKVEEPSLAEELNDEIGF